MYVYIWLHIETGREWAKEDMWVQVSWGGYKCRWLWKNKAIKGESAEWSGWMGSAARMRACKYDELWELWKSMALPSVICSMNVVTQNESKIEKLDRYKPVLIGKNSTECI